MDSAFFLRTRIGVTALLLSCAIALIPPIVVVGVLAHSLDANASFVPLLLQTTTIALISCALGFAAFTSLRKGSESLVDEMIIDQKMTNLRFDTAINNMSQGLCFFDGNHRLIVCNDKYAELYRLSRDLVRPGTTLRAIVDHRFSIGCFPRMDPAEYLRWRDSIAVSKIASDTVLEMKDGRTFLIHHEPMPDGGWVATHEDITAIERTKDELKKLNASLEQRVLERTAALESSNRDLETFAYSVAHDFRAPLRAMNGYSAIVLEEHGRLLSEQGRDYLTRIRTSSVRMGRLIDDLLNLARMARQDVKRSPVDLSTLAARTIAELRARDPGRVAEVKIAPGLKATGDPALLASLMSELLGNAWKFTAALPSASIEVGMQTDEGTAAYYVRDNGVGFDMAFANKLFTPFAQLHQFDESSGTGIGLALAKCIIDRHGGSIWAQSTNGQGAKFLFTLSV